MAEKNLKAYCNDEFLARTFFQNALLMLHRHALAVNLATKTPIKNNRPYPIEMKRLDKWTVLVNATEDIDRGCLVIPVFVSRNRLRSKLGKKIVRSNMEVAGIVEWRDGPDDRDVRVLIPCQPEPNCSSCGTGFRDFFWTVVTTSTRVACIPFGTSAAPFVRLSATAIWWRLRSRACFAQI